MPSATLDDFTAWNDQLLALAEAGVPLNIGLDKQVGDAARTLKQINATVARRVGRGETLSESLDDDEPIVPVEYRSLVEVGLHSGDLSTGLMESSRLAESVDQTQYAFRAALVYPLIVCGMAYGGLVAFCLFFVPTLEEVSRGLRVPFGSALQVLQMLSETLPYWVAIPPAMLLVGIILAYRGRKRNVLAENLSVNSRTWVPGMSQVVFQERCANFAETAAKLLDSGTSLDESLTLASESVGDPRLASGSKTLAEAVSRGELPSDQSAEAKQFPPFLRWALWHSEPTVGRAHALQMAAEIYRQSAARRAEKLRWTVPVVLSAVIGGATTLLFGMALFLPVVQLLEELAS